MANRDGGIPLSLPLCIRLCGDFHVHVNTSVVQCAHKVRSVSMLVVRDNRFNCGQGCIL